jgi:hypothetical protein
VHYVVGERIIIRKKTQARIQQILGAELLLSKENSSTVVKPVFNADL